MASNPAWCQPLSVWDGYVRTWIAEPSPAHILAACMYFDLRLVTGTAALAADLSGRIRAEAPAHPRFLGLMARDVVDRPLPVGFLGSVSVQRSGPHRGAVDIKGAGCIQLVGAARVHALELGLAETTTIARIAAAGARGLYRREDVVEISDAYEHLLRLRLAHQLDRLAAGEAPDNYVDPERLSHRDGLLLRAALKTIGHVNTRLEGVAGHLRVPIDGRHTAEGDARMAGEILLALLPALRGRGVRTLGELRHLQRNAPLHD